MMTSQVLSIGRRRHRHGARSRRILLERPMQISADDLFHFASSGAPSVAGAESSMPLSFDAR